VLVGHWSFRSPSSVLRNIWEFKAGTNRGRDCWYSRSISQYEPNWFSTRCMKKSRHEEETVQRGRQQRSVSKCRLVPHATMTQHTRKKIYDWHCNAAIFRVFIKKRAFHNCAEMMSRRKTKWSIVEFCAVQNIKRQTKLTAFFCTEVQPCISERNISVLLSDLRFSRQRIWVVAQCGLEGTYQRFGETYCFHLQFVTWSSKTH
jgi:hypothetical protein